MILADALVLADQGFHLFPLVPNSKLPAIKSWPLLATRDHDKIAKWSRKYEGCNYGIFTGRFGEHGALLVVDVDSPGHGAGKKDGGATLLRLELGGSEFPATLENATPTGGRHLVYTVAAPVKQGVDVLGDGLDIRSHGGYIVAPGSVVDAGEYFTDRPTRPVDAPAWLVEACGTPRTRSANRAPLNGVDPDRAEKRVIDYLATAERSVKGAGGDQAAYRVAAKCLALGASREMALDLMLSEHWDEGCGWSADRLQQKIEHAWRYMTSSPGADAPEAAFDVVPAAPEGEPQQLHPFAELNKEFAIALHAPDMLIYRCAESATGQCTFDRLKPQAFALLLADRKLDGRPLADAWLKSSRRRIYPDGVEFAPGHDLGARVLNLWGGFAVKPAPGDWSMFRDHIRTVVSGGDAAIDTYIMGWLATMVQRPGEPGHVALVLRGGRGTGKSTFGKIVGDLFGDRHFIHLSDPQQLTGRFNSHLACKVLAFADEAFFVGDRGSVPRLKAMITERTLTIEYKGVDIGTVRNCTHLVMASNDDFVVPSGADERRWCVIDVADSSRNDWEHFGKMRAQMDAGGLAAMLCDLLAYDLSQFKVGAIPKTQAGTEQKTSSLGGVARWLFDGLAAERLVGEDWADAPVKVSKANAFRDYQAGAKDRHEYAPQHAVGFWRQLRAILAKGHALLEDIRGSVGGVREQQTLFPPLEECRRAFEAFIGDEKILWGGG